MGAGGVRHGATGAGAGPGHDSQGGPAAAPSSGGGGGASERGVRGIGVRPLAVAAGAAAADLLEEERGIRGGRCGGLLCHQGSEAVASARLRCS